jgi:hypothetical protein
MASEGVVPKAPVTLALFYAAAFAEIGAAIWYGYGYEKRKPLHLVH